MNLDSQMIQTFLQHVCSMLKIDSQKLARLVWYLDKKTDDNLGTVDGSEILQQLRLVVHPIICEVLYIQRSNARQNDW